jgi:hypothetical protein
MDTMVPELNSSYSKADWTRFYIYLISSKFTEHLLNPILRQMKPVHAIFL